MKKIISVLTATRAEYGLLKPIIEKLFMIEDFDVRVVVTGAHLSSEFGLTFKEIENDGIIIDEKIEILLSSDTSAAISKSMGLAMIGFADYFERLMPDILVLLGDRYETLAVAATAMNQRIPIIHLYGGETTEGAIDESIRHAITKLSYLHFTSTEEYRRRVIKLGEDPSRVFCVGAIGIENILNEELMDISELEKSINFVLNKPYAMVTYHSVTLEDNSAKEQMRELLDACKTFSDIKYIFTKSNADSNGRIINQMIDEFVNSNQNAVAFSSLGTRRYLSALRHCDMVIGNSSSGIIEAPSFGVPTINIGDRQKGRLQALNVINCKPFSKDIIKAMEIALSDEFRTNIKSVTNPYGDGRTSEKIIEIIQEFVLNNKIKIKKKFYDF
jgi:GDP/UDP-N,N'-diacetylbacillosamine 2-epimerase (hydrolysing)